MVTPIERIERTTDARGSEPVALPAAVADATWLRRGYVLALSLVALLVLLGLVIVERVLSQQKSDASLINVAGRQRMLSQRLAKQALATQIAPAGRARADSARDLASSTDAWVRAHRLLKADLLSAAARSEVHRRLAAIEPDFTAIVAASVELQAAALTGDDARVARAVAAILAHEPGFLDQMEAIVALLDGEASARVHLLERIEITLVALTLLALLLEALLIFRPALLRLDRALVEEQLAIRALAGRSAQLAAVLAAVPDAVIHLDAAGRCVGAFGALPAPFSRPAGDLLGHAVAELLPTAAAADLRAAVARALTLRAAGRIEYVDHDGRTFEVRVAPSGADAALALFRELTEQRRLERGLVEIAGAERRRIGRDLHDGLCQRLAGLHLAMSAALSRARRGGAPPAASFESFLPIVEGALAEVRQITRTLHPREDAEPSLSAMLADLARVTSTLHGVECTVAVDLPTWAPSPDVAAQIHKIVQEAVSNAARHGAAESIHIEFAELDGAGADAPRISLRVVDDGRGFDPDAVSGRGLGLETMAHRARLLGGSMHIASGAGGTTLTFILAQRRGPGGENG